MPKRATVATLFTRVFLTVIKNALSATRQMEKTT